MYIYQDQAYVEASLPPLPYAPFNENAYSRMSERASKMVFSILHKVIRTIPKGRGYKDIGVDVLNRYLGKKVKTKDDELVDKMVFEFTHALSKDMANFWRLDRTKKEDSNPVYDAQMALRDYEYALSHHQLSADEAKSMHSLKTLTVAPVHVPWSNSLKKIPGFVVSDYPGTQKGTRKMAPKNTPFDKKKFREDRGKVTLLPSTKSVPISPPTLIFAREKKSYKPVQMEGDPRPLFGLSRKKFRSLKSVMMKGYAPKLKAFLDKHNIMHEKVLVPSLYDRVIVQYFAGPWRDSRHSGKPFQVTVFVKGEQAYDNLFATQREAEKAVSVWTKTIAKSRGGMQGWMNFTYNKRRFPLSPDKISRIIKVLSSGGRFKMPRTEGIYLIFRGKAPNVRNSWEVRREQEKAQNEVAVIVKQVSLTIKKMKAAAPDDRLEIRKNLIGLKKELRVAEEKLEKVKNDAKIDREVAQRVAPMKLKAPLKANIMMVESRE